MQWAPDNVDTWCLLPLPHPTSWQAINRHTETEMQYKGVVDAVRRMLADEGIAGFYKGELQSRPAVERLRASGTCSLVVGASGAGHYQATRSTVCSNTAMWPKLVQLLRLVLCCAVLRVVQACESSCCRLCWQLQF